MKWMEVKMKLGLLRNCVEIEVERDEEDLSREKDIVDCK